VGSRGPGQFIGARVGSRGAVRPTAVWPPRTTGPGRLAARPGWKPVDRQAGKPCAPFLLERPSIGVASRPELRFAEPGPVSTGEGKVQDLHACNAPAAPWIDVKAGVAEASSTLPVLRCAASKRPPPPRGRSPESCGRYLAWRRSSGRPVRCRGHGREPKGRSRRTGSRLQGCAACGR